MDGDLKKNGAFTLIELLVVIAIIAILAVVVLLTLNPAELLRQSRDANRVSDMATLSSAIGLYQADQSGASSYAMGTSSVIYTSLPDNSSSTCGDLGLLTLPTTTYQYHCATVANLRLTSSSGWIPINFQNISSGAPFGSLPIDPTNSSSSRLYYTYTTNGTQFEVTAAMESAKYQLGGSNDEISGDGAPLASVYAKGTNLTLEPLDYGDPTLVASWSFREGSSSVAYDWSGMGNNGVWSGTPVGTYGYYSAGKIGPYAGTFNGGDTITASTTGFPVSNGARTISAWIDISTTTNSSWANLLNYGSGNCTGLQYGLGYSADYLSTWGGCDDGGSSLAVPLNTWVFVAVTYSGGTTETFYLNSASAQGSLNGNVPLSTPAGSAVNIGNDNGSVTGLVDDVRVYTRALTTAQLNAMYSGGK